VQNVVMVGCVVDIISYPRDRISKFRCLNGLSHIIGELLLFSI
jgi:hypothetical protein